MLILVGGATLASPFLRPPQVDLDIDETLTQSPLAHAKSPTTGWGQLASAQNRAAPPPATVAIQPNLSLNPGVDPQSPTLPSWVAQPSPIDGLISQGTAPPWNGDIHQSRLQPLRPWGSDGQPRELPSTRPQKSPTVDYASTLPVSPWDTPRAPAKLVPIASAEPMSTWPDQALPEMPTKSMPPAQHAAPSAASLAGATLRATKTKTSTPASESPRSRPQFVFQPGFRPNQSSSPMAQPNPPTQ